MASIEFSQVMYFTPSKSEISSIRYGSIPSWDEASRQNSGDAVFSDDVTILFIKNPQRKSEENNMDLSYKNFKEVINNGKIVVLNMNIAKYKNLSKIIAAYLKLDFQSEVLSQLSKNNNLNPTVFMCDEYHEYVTLSDADFFAQSRESKCINIVSTQSYSSILNTLQNEASVKVIVQNLVNKLWLRTDDIYTIESAQKQIGREDKTKISKNVSENASETNYNFFTNSLISRKSNLSETISTHIQTDYIYDINFFTQNLETFSCLAFISNGNKILPPCKINLIPYFENIEIQKKKSDLKIV